MSAPDGSQGGTLQKAGSKILDFVKGQGKGKLPYQAKLHEYGIDAAKDDWLAYTFEILDNQNLDPIEKIDQIRPNLTETRKTVRKLGMWGEAGDDDTFYVRVIAWTRILNIVENIVDSDAEPESKVTLCRDMLYRSDMMVQVAVKKERVTPSKAFAFQGMTSPGGGSVEVNTHEEASSGAE